MTNSSSDAGVCNQTPASPLESVAWQQLKPCPITTWKLPPCHWLSRQLCLCL